MIKKWFKSFIQPAPVLGVRLLKMLYGGFIEQRTSTPKQFSNFPAIEHVATKVAFNLRPLSSFDRVFHIGSYPRIVHGMIHGRSLSILISTSFLKTPSFLLIVFARYSGDQQTLDKDPASFCFSDGRHTRFTVLVPVQGGRKHGRIFPPGEGYSFFIIVSMWWTYLIKRVGLTC